LFFPAKRSVSRHLFPSNELLPCEALRADAVQGILGIGRLHQEPVVREGAIVPAALLPLSLVVDHRLIDGVYACKFLARFMELISKPLRLLML